MEGSKKVYCKVSENEVKAFHTLKGVEVILNASDTKS